MCPYFARGSCKYGAKCMFSHARAPHRGGAGERGRPSGGQGEEETPPDLDPSHPGFNLPELDDLGLGSAGPFVPSPSGSQEGPAAPEEPPAPRPNLWLERGRGPSEAPSQAQAPASLRGPDAVYGAGGGGADLWERGGAVAPPYFAAGAHRPRAGGGAGPPGPSGLPGPPGCFAVDTPGMPGGFSSGHAAVGRPLCQYYIQGQCLRGEACPHVHGLQCHSCARFCLHPTNHAERAAHLMACIRSQKQARTVAESAVVECCICLERVMEKANPAERRFGLLACHHAFCLGCIRNWRSQNTSGMDVDAALRTCPVCRSTAHFVTPSPVWVTDPAEKDAIVERYKLKLKTIDCKHFKFGDNTCPFGASCFYRHQYRDGTLEEVTLRKVGAADGTVRVAKTVRLSDFLFPDLAG